MTQDKIKITFGKADRDNDPQYVQVSVFVTIGKTPAVKVGWLEKINETYPGDLPEEWFFISQNQGDHFSVLEGDNQPRGHRVNDAKREIREEIAAIVLRAQSQ